MAVEALAYEACPPLSLFEQGRDWLPVGKNLRQAYSRVMRQVVNANDDASPEVDSATLNTGFEAARAASEAFLGQWPAEKRPHVLLGAAAYLYAQGPQQGEPVRDALIWQLGRQRAGEGSGREPGIAHLMLAALFQLVDRQAATAANARHTDAGNRLIGLRSTHNAATPLPIKPSISSGNGRPGECAVNDTCLLSGPLRKSSQAFLLFMPAMASDGRK